MDKNTARAHLLDTDTEHDRPLPPKRTCVYCKVDYWIHSGEIHVCIDGGKGQRAALAAAYQKMKAKK